MTSKSKKNKKLPKPLKAKDSLYKNSFPSFMFSGTGTPQSTVVINEDSKQQPGLEQNKLSLMIKVSQC